MPAEVWGKIKQHKAYATSNAGMLFYQYLLQYLQALPQNEGTVTGVAYNAADRTLRFMSLLDTLFEPSKSDMLKIRIGSNDPHDQKLKMETILNVIQTEWCKTVIREEYNKTVKKIAAIDKILQESKPIAAGNKLGVPIAELSFGARLFKLDSTEADSFLPQIKSSFKHKALIIDFCATWCGPCISEFSRSKNLNELTKDLPIEFVYLCTSDGSDLEKWKTKIAEYQLRGTHIFVQKSIESRLMNLFSISGYPGYIYINSKGEYQAGIKARPSQLSKGDLVGLVKE